MEHRGRLCVFAKAPIAGQVKSRLASAVGADTSATLAEAFLRDMWSELAARTPLDPVLVLSGQWDRPELLPSPVIWSQVPGDLGRRLAAALSRALEAAPYAIALGSDSPGLPPRFLEHAVRLLEGGADAVLGPSHDGGFYLIGLRRCPPGLLSDLPWSSADTLRATQLRLREAGLTPSIIEPWFDIDVLADLKRLGPLLRRGEIRAPHTFEALRSLLPHLVDGGGEPKI